ncbi:MAG: 4-hydroxybenzoate octaprenyltransferase [Hoeflea sp.]|uniref:4-hydroxybenzoate octaprenyltransferase n=1 Tax=Hoeflea sp. TaxID=1940281 RepID=UPI001DD5BF58|nr:4-hydroxybenzoate octaprenyltransferase [Hoeflea sp.]MBU4527701.1 4-hydroxybenzoate octaprenyltransferase [Alphaproteobacteria bacterium]MBU4546431.1 4-hydroxybenzoate octaprenyltransferase [Alphaproteobacteria bacterium]MBU4553051.1 4-hydroxybenzoate octaprenyltransferase [Alphaproteobacteria bacterium]MBV1724123.1 4-hydroxybenzoate octaprenyltransferase [Hoeflea sp.]MBV1759808.1 4-hydroxybenzoate octaprenyltransferase [Hoeflea sp.]
MSAARDPIPEHNARVADAPSGNWVYRILPRALWPHAQLARWDRPIGWQLLMWPCFWSAALAANVASAPSNIDTVWYPALTLWHLFLFMTGAIAMRGAGCTWNDLVDHKIDAKVARTRSRPLPSRRISRGAATAFLVIQALVGLVVLIQFNWFSILLGISSLAIVAIYPFAKRFTDWPQFFLGLAFSWGALMGWAAIFGELAWPPVLLYAGAIAWTIGYDTIYAHQDKEDDALVGVRSTARLFGDNTKIWLVVFYGIFTAMAAAAFVLTGVAWPAFAGLAVAVIMLAWQIRVIDIDDADQCLTLFKANSHVGLIVFLGLIAALLV